MKRPRLRSSGLGCVAILILTIISVFPIFQSTPFALAAGTITGTVYRDYNANGARDAVEPQFAGITVTAFDSSGVVRGSATTVRCSGTGAGIDTNGTAVAAAAAAGCTGSDAGANYSLTASGTGPYRIEFSGWPAYVQPSAMGTANGTTVQFVLDGNSSNINLGFNNPAQFCENNPDIATSCYLFGDQVNGPNQNGASVRHFPYTSGTTSAAGSINSNNQPVGAYINGAYTLDAITSQTGAVWGMAYQRESTSLFLGSFMKRHTGFGPTDDAGTIYRIDQSAALPNASAYMTLNAGPNQHTPTNTAANAAEPLYFDDLGAFNSVGNTGLGDLELSDDEATLYAVNMYDGRVYAINIGAPALAVPPAPTAITPPTPTTGVNAAVGCAVANLRPGALKYHDGVLYVGLTCTGPAIADLRAYVYRYDISTSTFSANPVAEVALNYPRGCAANGGLPCAPATWQPWVTDTNSNPADDLFFYSTWSQYYKPQPWLLDLEIDEYGFMALNFADRAGHQLGNRNGGAAAGPLEGVSAGDLLRLAPGAGTWTIENNGTAGTGLPGGATTSGAGNNEGPGGGEFYYQDRYAAGHSEIYLAGAAQVYGKGEIVTSAFDPAMDGNYRAGGLVMTSNSTGRRTRSIELFGRDATGTFGKAAGIGDIEVLCDSAPIEIGNRAWLDQNANGIQDAGEPGLAGVTVQLYDNAGNPVAGGIAITDPNGNYAFSSDTSRTNTASAKYSLALLPNIDYQIQVATAQASLTGFALSGANTDASANGDARDSDATLSGGNAVISLTTGSHGANNHTYDFGFVPAVSVGNRVWWDKNNDSVQDGVELPIVGVKLDLFYDADNNGTIDVAEQMPIAVTTSDASGLYLFTQLTDAAGNPLATPQLLRPGTYVVGIAASNFAAGQPLAGAYSSGTTANANGTLTETAAPDPDTVASDTDDNGTKQTSGFYSVGVLSLPVTLSGNSEPTVEIPDADPNPSGRPDANDNQTVDFGFYTLQLGSQVWRDADNSGTINAADGATPGIANVRVRLFAADGTTEIQVGPDGIRGTADDAPGGVLTDASGNYRFRGLAAGNYIVEVDTTSGALTDYLSSSGSGESATPNNNLDNDDNGTVLAATTARSAAVTLTPNAAGAQNNNIITAASGSTYDPTVDFGFYTMSLGNLVWHDANNNGVFDAGETALDNLVVNLLDSGGVLLDSTVTNASGHYLFIGLAAGDYIVELDAANFTAGGAYPDYTSSTGTIGAATGTYELAPDPDTNTADSRDNGSNHVGGGIRSGVITIVAGGEPTSAIEIGGNTLTNPAPDSNSNLTVDFGIFAPVSLGNRVWVDENNNGTFDTGELAVPDGVQINLYHDTNGDNTIAGGETTAIRTTTTSGGLYLFANLVPGKYMVELDASNFSGAGALVGYTSSTGTVGAATGPVEAAPGPDADPSDTDDNGTLGAGGSIRSTLVTLTAGSEPTGENPDNDPTTPDLNENLTVDFGVFQPASLGNLVWYDANHNGVQDGETGVQNVTVALYDSSSVLIATATTDSSGNYQFTNLTPGSYYVVFSNLPAGNIFTGQDSISATDVTDSDADSISGQTGSYTLVAGESNQTLDAGIYNDVRASLGDKVWYDTNEDGVQDVSESGVPNVTVDLYQKNVGGSFVQIATTTTIADGSYLFSGLLEGDYYVQFTPPAGYVLTGKDLGGNDATDSDADPITHQTVPSHLDPGENDLTWDAGMFYGTVALGNRVWEDSNNNGVYNFGEPGITGATVTLYRDSNDDGTPDGAALTTATTNANGFYLFNGLTPDTYIVEVAPPAGYISSSGTNGVAAGPYEGAPTPDPDTNIDADDNGTTSAGVVRSKPITLTRGGEPDGEITALPDPDTDTPDFNSNLTIDFGFYQPLSLGNQIWHDSNDNGLIDGAELGISGVTVSLYDSNGLVATTTTDANGNYLFTNLAPDDYIVEVTTPSGFVSSTNISSTSDPNNSTDSDDNGVLVNATTVRAAAVTLATGGEPSDDPGQPVGNLNRNNTVDLGFYQTLSLGNLVWGDSDNDGVFNGSESGIDGATVNLYRDANANGQIDSGEFVATQSTTGGGLYLFTNLRPGDYIVELPAGNFGSGGALEHLASSTGGTSEPASDPDNDLNDDDNGTAQIGGAVLSKPVTLISGDEPITDDDADVNTNLSVDFGFYPLASIGNYVWLDTNKDGVQDGIESGVAGVNVQLYQPGKDGLAGTGDDVLVATTTTGASGDYQFGDLLPGDYFVQFNLPPGYAHSPQDASGDTIDSDADTTTGRTAITTLLTGEDDPSWDAGIFFTASLGDRIWLDQNANGIQDAGEPGLPGVTVTLYTSAGTLVGAPTTTDANGNYAFPNLPPGDYYIVVTPPAGYVITPTDQGANDGADSDADSITGTLPTTTIAPSENDPTWDAGLYQLVSLGNLVWHDYNNNGVVDGGESGIDGVVVNLYHDTNGNAAIDAGEFVATQTTIGAGQYLFPNLVPGSYLVQLDSMNFSGAGVLVGYVSSTGSIGTHVSAVGPYEPAPSPNNDMDDDDNGSVVLNQGIISAPITLVSGGEPTNDGDLDPNSNFSVDFGVFQPASLGSIVWYDIDKDGVRDPSELGVPGVTVTLYDGNGNPVATTLTDAAGTFQFINLVPGSYSVGFGDLPPGYTFTAPDQGSDDAADSDADPTTGLTSAITLVPGQNNPTTYAGIVPNPTAIALTSFTATREGDQVVVRWVTTAEINTWGFQLYRSADGQRANATRVTSQLIPGQGRGQGGASYSWTDTEVAAGVTYTYWLVEIEIGGATNEYGPATAGFGPAALTYHLFLPLAVR